jgi:uncharacterized protein
VGERVRVSSTVCNSAIFYDVTHPNFLECEKGIIMIRRALMVVAKQPAPGQTKTRLSPPLDSSQASALYECFLRDTLDIIRCARQILDFQPIIAYLPAGAEAYFRALAPDFDLLLQQGAGLSERLHNATSHCLQNGYDQAVIMDSDSPTLPFASVCAAFTTLEGPADVSLGPCDDGGYYLIGLKKPVPALFLNITMSTPQVVADTLAQAEANKLTVQILPTCYDIDFAADLHRLVSDLANLPNSIAQHTRHFIDAHPALVMGLG